MKKSNLALMKNYVFLHFLFLISILTFSSRLWGQSFPINGNIQVCEGEAETYTAPSSSNTYVWTVSSGNSFVANGNSAVVDWGQAGGSDFVSLSVYNAGTLISSQTLNVTINTVPIPQITSNFDSDCIPPSRKEDGSTDPEISDCHTVCEGSDVIYTTPQNGANSYSWTVIGNYSSIANASTNQATVSWGTPGQAKVVIEETTPQGCIGTDTICIEIVPKPISKFHVNQASGSIFSTTSTGSMPAISVCMGETVCFNEDVSGGYLYHWDFGNGNMSTAANPCETFQNPGSYIVGLTSENECHCTETSYLQIDVNEFPGPEIVCTNVLCENGKFNYSAIMPNGPCSGGNYDWSVSGNGQITAVNGSPITPTNNYNGTGITDITIDWSSGPIGTISLQVSGCGSTCDQITSVDIPIIPSSIDIEGNHVVCTGESGFFQVQCFPGTEYDWKINGASLGEISNELWWDFPGATVGSTYTITVEYENEYLSCTGVSNTFNVTILDPFEISGLEQICEGTTTNINGPSSGNFNWEVKDGLGNLMTGTGFSQTGGASFPFPSSAAAGTYTVIAYDNPSSPAYCNEYAIHGIHVIPSPPAPTVINGDFQVCDGESYIYTASPSSTNYYLKWEVLNNGSTTTYNGNSITVNWTSGPKSISLYQVSKENDCESAAFTLSVTTKVLSPLSLSGPNSVCANTATATPEVYSASPSNFDDYTWSISPATHGSIVSGQGSNTIHVIWNNVTGSATISATPKVCTSTGTTATYSVTITPPPAFTISGPSTICQGENGVFTTSASGTYSWEVKDASTNSVVGSGTTTGTTINHTFGQHGSYILSVDGSIGTCNGSSTTTHAILVNPKPVANLSYTGNIKCISSGVVNFTVSVQGTAPYTYTWYKDATIVSTGPSNTYSIGPSASHAGNYSVRVVDANGCEAITNVIRVDNSCPSGIGPGNPCNHHPGILEFDSMVYVFGNCTTLDFMEMPLGGAPPPDFTTWQIANLATLTGPNVSYNFPASGIYPVTIIGSYNGHCDKTYTQDVLVPVQSDFDINFNCTGGTLQLDLTNTSNVVHGPLSTWNHEWKIFDGGTQVGPTYTTQDVSNISGLTSGTVYTVRLKVDRSYNWNMQTINAECTYEESFTMPTPASAAFTFSPNPNVCVNTPVEFTDNSLGDIASWNWNFGDGSSITTQDPEKEYSTVGIYSVNLTVTDDYGCTSSISQNVDVKANDLSGTFSGIPSGAICPSTLPVTLSFAGSGSGGPIGYTWTTGSTTNSTTVNQTSNNYVFLTNSYGCYKEFGPASVEVDEIPDPFIMGDAEYCLGEEIELSSNYGSNYTYQWFLNGSAISGETEPSISISEGVGTYTYTVQLSSSTPCTKTSNSHVVTVHSLPTVPIISTNPTPACPSSPVTLSVTNPSNYSYINWSNGNAGTSMTTTASGIYVAVGTDANGCSSLASGEVFELPDFCGFMCGCYTDCIESGNTFSFPGIVGNFQYWEWQEYVAGSWNAIASQSGTGAVNDFTTSSPGSYKIRLYVVTTDGCDGFSCEAEIDLSICGEDPKPETPCEGHAFMEYVNCELNGEGEVVYDFGLFVDFFPPGGPCSVFDYSLQAPNGTIINLTPGQLSAGGNFITGNWNTGLTFYAGQTVCFTLVIENTCDGSKCYFDVCFEVPECGDETTGEIPPCDGYIDGNISDCIENEEGFISYQLDIDLVFNDNSGCNTFSTMIIPPFGNTMGISWSNINGSGGYHYLIDWQTGGTYIAAGTYCFDVIITNECDGTQCLYQICFTIDDCGDISIGRKKLNEEKNQLKSSEFIFYPNPAKDQLNILFPEEGSYQLKLFDLSGKLVFNEVIRSTSDRLARLPISNLQSGVYVIKCQNNQYNSTQMIVIEE